MSVDVVTFGCRLNAYESEVIRDAARRRGRRYRRHQYLRGDRRSGAAGAPDHPPAQARAARSADRRHRLRGADRAATFAAMPEVDRVLGNDEKLDPRSWRGSDTRRGRRHHGGDDDCAAPQVDGIEGHTRAFVQVQNGCDHRCTFCIIPYGRGNSRSLPPRDVVAQVRRSSSNGYREVVLTGVDITSYDAGGVEARRAGQAGAARRAGAGAAAAVLDRLGRGRCRSARCAGERAAADAASASVACRRATT